MMNITAGQKSNAALNVFFIDPERKALYADLEEQLIVAHETEAFEGAADEVCCIHNYQSKTAILLCGLGKNGFENIECLRRAAAHAAEYAEKKRIRKIALNVKGYGYHSVRAIAEALVMTEYRYTDFLTEPPERFLQDVAMDTDAGLEKAVGEGIVLGESVCIARDLVNEPSNSQTPQTLAEEVAAFGQKYGFDTEILCAEKIHELGMTAFEAVAQGSPNPPALIVMRYMGKPDTDKIIGLVGKGVTFDSGGLNLKTGRRFITMKHDMAGGATVIGAMCAISQKKLRVNVVAVVAAAENLISGKAYRPGDIIRSMSGKSIQINSTDAEGRLTLIDACTYAIRKEHVSCIVDICTLTGAARRILGDYGAPVLGNNDEMWETLRDAADMSGEIICRIPLIEDARKSIWGDVSDYVNTSLEETGGMVTAALFIEEFVQNLPWMHIDAAGPLWLDRNLLYSPKGGSGWGVRMLYHFVAASSKKV